MNKYFHSFLIILVCCATFGIEMKLGPAIPPDPVKEAQRRLAKRQAKLAKTGGRINDMREMKGMFLFVNASKHVSTAMLKGMTDDLRLDYLSDIRVAETNGLITMKAIPDVLKKFSANAGVFFLESDAMPTLLVAPESRWAVVNVSALRKDNPDSKKFERRIRKEYYRAFAGLACSGATVPLCVTKVATSLEELDALKSSAMSSEVVFRGEDGLKAMGITPYKRTTYLEACEDGWAPTPTNDYQKAIWERVKADKERGPAKPITIPPPTKK